MTDDRIRPSLARSGSPRRCGGVTGRTMLGVIAAAALVVVLMVSVYERRANEAGTHGALLERGMSPGHRMLNQEAGRTLPSNAPRIQRADALVTRVSGRFRTSKEKAAQLALITRDSIAKKHPEDVLDVLDAALFATEGMAPGSVPPLEPVLGLYAKARLEGAGVPAARDMTRAFVQARTRTP
ncbi:hypothetical protein JI752_010155 [Lysobacter sp. MMG2]|uniref:hypothetical protein n=1 Tax=Lysobacter sp. MMG2 TaxID=2801338 RepID=UPI001C231513|nr:hypothetical protein [Lysobacter sp. MMG2]MBU8976499.1 hypothetical protein [Lysobacter sp. MMG2]